MKKKRYFIVCTVGRKPDMTISMNLFDVKTDGSFPTHEYLINRSEALYPNQSITAITGLTEMSKKDFNEFTSEQKFN